MSAAKSKRWRTVRRRDGETVLRSPDGREWLGTAAEVREAAMTPWRRRMLADGLRVQWLTTRPRTAERSELVRERRRNAITAAVTDARFNATCPAYLPPAVAVMAEAAARSHGMGLDEWVAATVAASVGRPPLDRHERAALRRIKGR